MCRYVDMKWSGAAPKSRRSIAEAPTTVTPALLATTRGAPDAKALRLALLRWVLVAPARRAGPPPDELAMAVQWLERSTVRLSDFGDRVKGAVLTRAALDLLAARLDGKQASPTTAARKRAVFYNALGYAVELGLLPVNPVDTVSWSVPLAAGTVDRRVVVNPTQARALLRAVGDQGEAGRRLVTFFACLYFGAFRPAEALGLRGAQVEHLPATGWGELVIGRSTPRAGRLWTDSGRSRCRSVRRADR